jgi:hypothetical protein
MRTGRSRSQRGLSSQRSSCAKSVTCSASSRKGRRSVRAEREEKGMWTRVLENDLLVACARRQGVARNRSARPRADALRARDGRLGALRGDAGD